MHLTNRSLCPNLLRHTVELQFTRGSRCTSPRLCSASKNTVSLFLQTSPATCFTQLFKGVFFFLLHPFFYYACCFSGQTHPHWTGHTFSCLLLELSRAATQQHTGIQLVFWRGSSASETRQMGLSTRKFLHLLLMWTELPPEYVESQVQLAGQAPSWCREPSSPSLQAEHTV